MRGAVDAEDLEEVVGGLIMVRPSFANRSGRPTILATSRHGLSRVSPFPQLCLGLVSSYPG
jgi:hypothetical protein